LEEHTEADVVVVGGGIAGLSVAYELSLNHRKVVVLEAGTIGGGMTGRTTAHLSNALDDGWSELMKLRGPEDAHRAADSHTRAIQRIEEIIRHEGIDCEFERVDGYLFLAQGDDPQILDRELEAARRLGILGVEKVARAPLPGNQSRPALRFPRQGRFHPLKYLAGLTRTILREGGRLYSGSHVAKFHGGKDAYVETDAGWRVRARAIVVATNSPTNDRVVTHTKQAPYRTFAVAAQVTKGSVVDALYWDTQDPYHYVRLAPQPDARHDLLIVGGEDHKTGQADDGVARLQRLEHWAREHFPAIESFTYRWSGQVMETVDYLGFIGRNGMDAQNVYIATGDSGMGMTHGVIAGMLISDLILGLENPWAKLYDPGRVTLAAIGKYAKENMNVAAQYADLVTAGDIKTVDDLAPGVGAVIRRGLRKVAVFRDKAARVHELSAICPHMGCVVHWNSLETCWDCPCHGSQFAVDGSVINGPSLNPLTNI
jgi:glycine/D-amino acid oxidase-like deaminating enzyme/nitrite reductase/ring-hydroxylating ferredoxin subunit